MAEKNGFRPDRTRCNLCGEIFEAEAPASVGEKKYDETAAAMIGFLKYGSGVSSSPRGAMDIRLQLPSAQVTHLRCHGLGLLGAIRSRTNLFEKQSAFRLGEYSWQVLGNL
ncbi:MAG TPA: hypothetical protein VMO17_00510 [Terriglobia bacterium]|nr:hypothetical protein [Terriglobia bacterium]